MLAEAFAASQDTALRCTAAKATISEWRSFRKRAPETLAFTAASKEAGAVNKADNCINVRLCQYQTVLGLPSMLCCCVNRGRVDLIGSQ